MNYILNIIVLRNKSMRLPGTTSMGFLMCAATIGDSSSVTAAGRRSLKKSLEAEVATGTPEQATVGSLWSPDNGRSTV